jgi:hypothetical protein
MAVRTNPETRIGQPALPCATRAASPRWVRATLPLALLSLGFTVACDSAPTQVPGAAASRSGAPALVTSYGPAVRVGEGIGRSYFITTRDSVVEIGVALSEAAMRGLPAGAGHGDGSHAHYNEFLMRMHPRNPTPYQFVELNWNPEGHEPAGIYDLPHFDFHFYTISLEERNAIDPADPLWAARANNVPAPAFVPDRYVPAAPPVPGITPADIAVPRMGVHWMDVASPELVPGNVFTETFIYGSWDGRMIFAEPMITRAFLQTKPQYSRTLPTAGQGYNPGSYRIYWDAAAREYRVALADLPRM